MLVFTRHSIDQYYDIKEVTDLLFFYVHEYENNGSVYEVLNDWHKTKISQLEDIYMLNLYEILGEDIMALEVSNRHALIDQQRGAFTLAAFQFNNDLQSAWYRSVGRKMANDRNALEDIKDFYYRTMIDHFNMAKRYRDHYIDYLTDLVNDKKDESIEIVEMVSDDSKDSKDFRSASS